MNLRSCRICTMFFRLVLCSALGMTLLLLSSVTLATGKEVTFALPDNPYALDPDRACGPICLTFLTAYYGKNQSCRKVAELCPPGPGGTSMDKLQAAAMQLGYKTLAVHLTANQLKRLNFPTILHLRNSGEGHFVVYVGWDSVADKAIVFSPPRQLDRISISSLAERFSGRALIVSQTKTLNLGNALAPPVFNWSHWVGYTGLIIFAVFCGAFVWRFHRRRGVNCCNSKIPVAVCMGCLLIISGCFDKQASLGHLHVDKGEVRQGTNVTHTYRVQNIGSKPFKVKKIEKACRCQVVDLDMEHEVLPNEFLSVSLEIPTDGMTGRVLNRIILRTNSNVPKLKDIELSLTATVTTKVRTLPSQLEFGNIDGKQQSTKRLRVESLVPGVLDHYIKSDTDNPLLSVKLVEKQIGTLLFDVTFDKNAPPGDIFGTVVFHFNHPEYPRIETKVFGRKLGKIKAVPSRINLGISTGKELVQTKVRLQSVDNVPFRITEVKSPGGIVVDWNKNVLSETQTCILQVSGKSSQNEYIVIRTTRSECPVLRIPIIPES